MTDKAVGMRDQRVNSRLRTCLACEVRWDEGVTRGYLLSVSLTGALISSSLDPPKGAPVSIALELPGLDKKVSLKGQVVRAHRGSFSLEKLYHFGIRFNGITPDSMQLVKAVLASKDTCTIVRNDRVYERRPQRVRT